MSLCQCGCGLPAPIAKASSINRGWVKGQAVRYINGHFRHPAKSVPYLSRASGDERGKVFVHVWLAEQALGHRLPFGTEVHHVDENKRNNANSNLVICQDRAYHTLLHLRARVKRAGGDPNRDLYCSTCRTAKPIDAFYRAKASRLTGRMPRCIECFKAYLAKRPPCRTNSECLKKVLAS